jgi:hypothetical protein
VIDCLADEAISSGIDESEAQRIADAKGGKANGYIVKEDDVGPGQGELF